MGGRKIRNLSYKKVEEHKSGVLCLVLCLNFGGERMCGKKMYHKHYYCEC